uniref:Integral membrane protein n=1 Tax=Streptomyces sp. NBC_00003 TaxID=2903608 RepID=A0AAU2VFU5_9ACTN
MEKREGHNSMTGRALEALAALLFILLVSIIALTPGIHRSVLAAFALVNAATSAISPFRAAYASRGNGAPAAAVALRLSLAAALTLTLLTAGTSLAVGLGGGLYWLPAAFVLAVVVAAVNAWVLLVEVLR